MKETAELQFLKWFYQNTDFGPASCDVMFGLKQAYEREVGKLPKGYEQEGEE